MQTILSQQPHKMDTVSQYYLDGSPWYHWPDDEAITAITEGRAQPATVEHAITMVLQRFGCAYRFLDNRFQDDADVQDAKLAADSYCRPETLID